MVRRCLFCYSCEEFSSAEKGGRNGKRSFGGEKEKIRGGYIRQNTGRLGKSAACASGGTEDGALGGDPVPAV